jgi:hypothetical protein
VCDGDLTGAIVVANNVNTQLSGEYVVTYNVADSSINAAAEVVRTVNVVDTTAPVITLVGDAEVILNVGDTYNELGAVAEDACDGILTGIVPGGDVVDSAVVGVYVITYTVTDAAGNMAEVTRTVSVVDLEPPYVAMVEVLDAQTVRVTFSEAMAAGALDAASYTISGSGLGTLNAQPDEVSSEDAIAYTLTWACPGVMLAGGNVTITVNAALEDTGGNAMAAPFSGTHQGGGIAELPVITLTGDVEVTVECGGVYVDAGATAAGQCGAVVDVTVDANAVDTSVVGMYEVVCNAVDAAGNAAEPVVRTVIVVDTTAPQIALVGDDTVVVECGGEYADAGATAVDVCEGDLTANIIAMNYVDTYAAGEYTVDYEVVDGHGNATSLSRTVTVVDTTPPVISLVGDNVLSVECGGTLR